MGSSGGNKGLGFTPNRDTGYTPQQYNLGGNTNSTAPQSIFGNSGGGGGYAPAYNYAGGSNSSNIPNYSQFSNVNKTLPQVIPALSNTQQSEFIRMGNPRSGTISAQPTYPPLPFGERPVRPTTPNYHMIANPNFKPRAPGDMGQWWGGEPMIRGPNQSLPEWDEYNTAMETWNKARDTYLDTEAGPRPTPYAGGFRIGSPEQQAESKAFNKQMGEWNAKRQRIKNKLGV